MLRSATTDAIPLTVLDEVNFDQRISTSTCSSSIHQLHQAKAVLTSADDAEKLMMLVQFTRFKCGIFAVGTTSQADGRAAPCTTGQHLVADGRAARSFTVVWGTAARGAAMDDDPVY
ncbi:hypothetical protein PR202_ga22439 [Eleusine coracana subsp. coracana]|uniref:Uncharacterized protein n=1 Tax=Eleusine coracana subsp. coracana TaxID=191504 RepID=A0AAV5D294_ELECO|nr:hypothetical protein PR202_ga22439 [Eleusine coracana subsp. coracana]